MWKPTHKLRTTVISPGISNYETQLVLYTTSQNSKCTQIYHYSNQKPQSLTTTSNKPVGESKDLVYAYVKTVANCYLNDALKKSEGKHSQTHNNNGSET